MKLTLTPRYLDVAKLLLEGNSDKEIGAALKIAARTVKQHKRRMFYKLGAQDLGCPRVRLAIFLHQTQEQWKDKPDLRKISVNLAASSALPSSL